MAKDWKIMKVDNDFDRLVKDYQESLQAQYKLPKRKKSIFSTILVTRQMAEELKKKQKMKL